MLAKQDYKQNHHGHPSAESRRDGRPLHSQFRKAETSENQGIVAYYIQHIHHHRHQHRIHRLVGAAQRSGKSKRQRLEKGKRPYNTHIVHAVLHQFGPQPHQPQDRLRTPEQQHADAYTHREVHQKRYSHHLHHLFMQPCAEILRTQHGSTEINHLKHQESQHDNLIAHPYGSHTVVRMAAQHNGIHRAKHHN